MSEDALEPEPLHHLGQDAALQRVIDELVVDGPQRSVGDLADRLVATLRQRGMPAMPKPWIQAVAAAAADGNPYVVSASPRRRKKSLRLRPTPRPTGSTDPGSSCRHAVLAEGRQASRAG